MGVALSAPRGSARRCSPASSSQDTPTRSRGPQARRVAVPRSVVGDRSEPPLPPSRLRGMPLLGRAVHGRHARGHARAWTTPERPSLPQGVRERPRLQAHLRPDGLRPRVHPRADPLDIDRVRTSIDTWHELERTIEEIEARLRRVTRLSDRFRTWGRARSRRRPPASWPPLQVTPDRA